MPRSSDQTQSVAPAPPLGGAIPVIEMIDVAVGSMRDLSSVVVESVNWTVLPREYWVIGGLQGSGKSDFLTMTGGLMAPAAGSYRLFGHQMPIFDEARLKERLRMGLVFETGQIFNHLTVRENISLPLRYQYNLGKAEAADRVNELLEALELGPWADSTPGAIGRNWQKRVGLGRALILEPELLLLDNPVAGLDLRHLDFWMKFLDELRKGHPFLKRRPMSLAVTTADLRPWRGGPHRFAILKDKKMTVLGSGAEAEQASAALLKDLIVLDNRS